MARVLVISSHVVRGHVGLRANLWALQGLGHEVWALPTVVLSNHPGHAHVARTIMAPEAIAEMMGALAQNGWLEALDAVLTGYMPSAAHVDVVSREIARLKAARPLCHLCDPILGDLPGGLYVGTEVAKAVGKSLAARADIITPNRFELAWLSGREVTDGATARQAAARLGCPLVLATSLPAESPGRRANLLFAAAPVTKPPAPQSLSNGHWHTVVDRGAAPHGTGDLLAGLFLGHHLSGKSPETAFDAAVAGVDAALKASRDCDELALDAPLAAILNPFAAT